MTTMVARSIVSDHNSFDDGCLFLFGITEMKKWDPQSLYTSTWNKDIGGECNWTHAHIYTIFDTLLLFGLILHTRIKAKLQCYKGQILAMILSS
jgi:hypothetical protein